MKRVREYQTKKYKEIEQQVELESYLAKKRIDHKMKKLSVDDVILDEEQNIMKDVPGYSPFQRISEEHKNNGSYPGEI